MTSVWPNEIITIDNDFPLGAASHAFNVIRGHFRRIFIVFPVQKTPLHILTFCTKHKFACKPITWKNAFRPNCVGPFCTGTGGDRVVCVSHTSTTDHAVTVTGLIGLQRLARANSNRLLLSIILHPELDVAACC